MNKRLLIIILVTLILLLLGGFVLYKGFFEPTPEPGQEEPGSNLFPFFGKDREDSSPENTTIENTQDTVAVEDNIEEFLSDNNTNPTNIPKLRKVWSEPVGGGFIGLNDDNNVVVRFTDRATGHVYQTHTTSTLTTRLTNTTIPKIQEVLWVSMDKLLIRYLRDNEDIVETFAATVVGSNATTSKDVPGELRGNFLQTNIKHIDILNSNELFYLVETDDVLSGVVSRFDGTQPQQVFSSFIRDWLPMSVDQNNVALTTKASVGVPGSIVILNTNTKSIAPLLSNIFGLNASVWGNYILYTSNDGSNIETRLLDRLTRETSVLSIKTVAEKCVKGTSSSVLYCAVPINLSSQIFPDSWYQGITHFQDQLWSINTSTGESYLVFDPTSITNDIMDMVDLQVGPEGKYVLFKNKTDNMLWLLRLVEEDVPVNTSTTTLEY